MLSSIEIIGLSIILLALFLFQGFQMISIHDFGCLPEERLKMIRNCEARTIRVRLNATKAWISD
jgi:hypothetical protein